MSTRCNIIVEDDSIRIQIYRHHDGYPNTEHGVLATLQEVFPYAWELPRFNADDFSAAMIAAWKKSGGSIRIDGNPEARELLHGDIEYLYTITHSSGDGCIHVKVEEIEGEVTDVEDTQNLTHHDICPEEPEEPSDGTSGLEPMLGGKG